MHYSQGSKSNLGAPDIEFQFFNHPSESDYPAWWTLERFTHWFRALPEDSLWICYICISALMGIVWVAVGFSGMYYDILDAMYNIAFAIHVVAIAYNTLLNVENADISFWTVFEFLLDIMTFSHFVSKQKNFKLFCYYLRLYRPFRYLWSLNDYNLKGSIPGTTLKFCYIFLVLRVTWALIWLNIDEVEKQFQATRRVILELNSLSTPHEQKNTWLRTETANQFLSAFYIVNKMFIPVGPSIAPGNDIERIACMLVMMTGCMVVTGAALASLSLVISIYMRPEESFRTRYRLIMKEMKESHVSQSLREKVESFYKMYWHKQRAVSATQLMPTFPPTLPAAIYADIYFEATQKCRILRDLSYQFLSEVSKKMQTVHYIPGDVVIKRCSTKSSIIFITCGDLEMLTAEDDSTAILRMTRGTILASCAGVVAAGCGPAHLEIRAATFCTAHVLAAGDLWRVALKHGRSTEQAEIILSSFYDHLERVKKHYSMRMPEEAKYKSSILQFKRNLMALKEAKDSSGNLLLARADLFLEVAGCYLMRNCADTSLVDEADGICLHPTFPCILQPVSSLQVAWNFFVATIIIIVCLTHPYYLVFMKNVPVEFRFYDYLVTVVYSLDLIVHLSTGANAEEGVPITFAQTSSQQMRSHWFVLDVFGTLPIFEFIGNGHFAGINKILRLPKVFRVLKTLEDWCVYRGNVIRFLSYTLLLLIACYLIAALQQGFMCFQFGYCLVTNFTHSPYWQAMPLDQETVQNRLTFGLYWAISMMTFTTHMEPWGPENWNNVFYTMFVLEICIVLRIFMEAVYSATIMVTTALREDYSSCIADVKNFLIRNQVDPIMRQRFITYLQLCWYTDKAFTMTSKKKSIFYDLPAHVYQDIVARQSSKYILSIPFMKFLSKEDLKNVSSKAKLFYTSPNEILLNTGDISNEMYVIKQGICEVLSPETGRVVGSLGIRNHFGILECILRLPAFYTIRAVTHVQVFSISRKHLLDAIAAPQIKGAIDFAKNQAEYERLMKHHKSFVMYSPLDPTPNMEQFPLPKKYEQDFAFLHPFEKLGVLSVLKYVFPRFTIRPDGKYLTRYEWFRGLCSLVTAMVFPGYCYMVLQWPELYFVTLLLDMAAYFDIVQRTLVGYFNEEGILIYHPSSTAAHYLKGAFITDLCGCLPMENLEGSRTLMSEGRYQISKIRQLLMMNRLIQLYRLPSALGVFSSYIERRDVILVIKAIPLFVVVLNVFTSLLVLYSVNIFYSEDSCFIQPLADVGGSWINLFNNAFRFNITESPFNMHLACYFWVVYQTTTTGYNSISPSNFELMEILFIAMVVGAMIITYFSVRIISIRANVNKALAEFQEHMKDIIAYMKKEALDEELQRDVFNYYEYNWDKMGGINYRHVLKLCQQITLRTDAILHIYGPTFAKCPILSECDVSLLRLVGRAVHSMYFLRDMRIVESDDVIMEMYFVDYGCIHVHQSVANDTTIVKLPRGSIFGNLEDKPTIRCPVSLIATTKVHLLKINSQLFYKIIEEFPRVRELMKEHNPDNSNYILGTYDAQKSQICTLIPPIVTSGRKGLIKHLYFKNSLLQYYYIIVSLVCVYLDVYNAGFQDNRTALIAALYALDAAFYVKILIQYSLPLIVQSESIRMVLLPIRKQYFKEEFRYDLISCIPIELLCLISKQHRWMIFALLRLNRMFRIVTLYKCLRRHQERITNNLTLSTILSVFIWFTLFVHTTTSVWYFIGVLEEYAEPKSSWLHNDKGESWCNNMYVCALYFILTTFTQNGVGDILPKKHSEVIFVSILQLISTLVFMMYVGEFSNIIQYQSFRSFSFYCMYLELQEFMKNNRVSKNLVTLVNKYSLHLWRESRGVQEPHFLNTAPRCLKLRIMSAAYLHHLQRHHIFEDCEPAFLRQLVGFLRLYTYNEGMYVVKESEITDAMYLIHTGKVHEYAEEHVVLPRIYPAGSYFGVLQGLEHDVPYTHSYITLIKSQVLTLRLDDWAYLLQHFPLSRDAIYRRDRFDGGGGKGHGRFDGRKPSRPTRVRVRSSNVKPRFARTRSISPLDAEEPRPPSPPPPPSKSSSPTPPTTSYPPSTSPSLPSPSTSPLPPPPPPPTSPSPPPLPTSSSPPPPPTSPSFPSLSILHPPSTTFPPSISPSPPPPSTSPSLPPPLTSPSLTPPSTSYLPPTPSLPSTYYPPSSSPSPPLALTHYPPLRISPTPPLSPTSSLPAPPPTFYSPSTALPSTSYIPFTSSPHPSIHLSPSPAAVHSTHSPPSPPSPPTDPTPRLSVHEEERIELNNVKSELMFNSPPGPTLDANDTRPVYVQTDPWPLDSRHDSDGKLTDRQYPHVPPKDQISDTLLLESTGTSLSDSQMDKIKSALSMDAAQNESSDFMDKVASTAKKMVNTFNPNENEPHQPNYKTMENDDVDVLLIQEEEQVTESLIKQFDETDGLSKDDKENVIAEKHMVDIDISRMPTKLDVNISQAEGEESNVVKQKHDPVLHSQTNEMKKIFSNEVSQSHSYDKLLNKHEIYNKKQNLLDNDENEAEEDNKNQMLLDKVKKETEIDKTKQSILHDDKKQLIGNGKKHYSRVENKPHSDTGPVEHPTINLEDESTELPDNIATGKHEQATSTSKLNRRLIHVRYEDDNKTEQKEKGHSSTDQRHTMPTGNLTREQKNNRKIDVDTPVKRAPESDEDEEKSIMEDSSTSH